MTMVVIVSVFDCLCVCSKLKTEMYQILPHTSTSQKFRKDRPCFCSLIVCPLTGLSQVTLTTKSVLIPVIVWHSCWSAYTFTLFSCLWSKHEYKRGSFILEGNGLYLYLSEFNKFNDLIRVHWYCYNALSILLYTTNVLVLYVKAFTLLKYSVTDTQAIKFR